MKHPRLRTATPSALFVVGLSLMLAGTKLLPLTYNQSYTFGATFFGLGALIAIMFFIFIEGVPDQRMMERLETTVEKLEALINEIKLLKR
ncbi:MAG: hypothetical protein JRN68_04760 [Nitrososphaerota archaeon]|nr:hypothetical protein [Nitrososphaerota archaeon]